MKDSNVNLVIKYLAKEELTSDEFELVRYLKESNNEEFEEISLAYDINIFSNLNFDTKAGLHNVNVKLKEKHSSIHSLSFYQQVWFKVAASILLLISIGILGGTQYHWNINLINNTAQLQNIQLPDGSELILDKNATIQYSRTLFNEFSREVSLSGRAHFHITKNPNQAFIVHNPMIDVQVLGTQFTINQANDLTQIILEEGIIKLDGDQLESAILMGKAGSQVILNETGIIKENIVSSNLYASWTEERLSFKQCTVEEVFQFLEDSYGIDVAVDDSSKLNRTLYGSAPSDDPHLIIHAINKILNTEIESSKKN